MSRSNFAITTALCNCLLPEERRNDHQDIYHDEYSRLACCRGCRNAVGDYAYRLQVPAEPDRELGRNRENSRKRGAAKGDTRTQAGWQSALRHCARTWLSNQCEGHCERQSL